MGGPIMAMLGKAIGAMLAQQVGSGLGALAGEVLTASDVGLPLGAPGKAALVPANVAGFAEGLDVTRQRRAALPRAARGRPPAALRRRAVAARPPDRRGHRLRPGHRDQHRRHPGDDGGAAARRRPEQPRGDAGADGRWALRHPPPPRSRTPLSSGSRSPSRWSRAGSTRWSARPPPSGCRRPRKLQEAVRRRRAAGGPAEETFASLVGLELRPRRLRDASTLWGSLRTRQGAEARDGVWMSPHLLPTDADLDDPLGFREGSDAPQLTDDDFDAELRNLLDGGIGRRGRRPTRGGVTAHAEALDALRALGAADRRPGQAPRRLRRAPRRPPRRAAAVVLPRPPDGGHPRALPRARRRAAQPAPQGAAVVRLRRSPRAG